METRKSFTLCVHQATVEENAASIGSMHLYVVINYSMISMCSQTVRCSDKCPIWNELFHFDCTSDFFDLSVFHKPTLRGPVEVGSCRVRVKNTKTWFEMRKSGKQSGFVRLSIREEYGSSPSHSTTGSWDMREEYLRTLSELEQEKQHCVYYKEMYRQIRNEQACSFKQMQQDLVKKQRLVELQEANLEIEKEKLRSEKAKLQERRSEINSIRQRLEVQSQKIKQRLLRQVQTDRVKERHTQIANRINAFDTNNTQYYPLTDRPPLHPISFKSSRIIQFE